MPEAHAAIRFQIVPTAALEGVGLFWLGAELAILFFMLAARRHIQSRPLPHSFSLNQNERRRALIWMFCFAGFAAAVLARHVIHALSPPPSDTLPLVVHRARVHMTVWSGFVTGWVALELAIVYQGYRGYTALKKLLATPMPAAATAAGRIVMLVFAGVFLLQSAAHAQTLLAAAREQNQVYYNAMYLYLRLAGVVWIAAEWVAAALVWRAYVLLRAAAGKAGADV